MTPLADTPALPLHTAGPYVAAAYIVFVAVILIYVTIMAFRLRRNERELAELRRQVLDGSPQDAAGERYGDTTDEPAETVGRR
jgi:hypothetical protein